MRKLNFKKMNGLVPAIVQDADNKAVLMLGFMNEEAYKQTLEFGKVIFYSRTRDRLWQKGEESGNFLEVVSIAVDCDEDTLLINAKPKGPTCHTGEYSCFEKNESGPGAGDSGDLTFLCKLFELIADRKEKMPADSYTTSLFEKGIDKILEKIGEEAVEVIIAAKNKSKQRIVEESCDLIYHLFVMLVEKNVGLENLSKEFKKRHLG